MTVTIKAALADIIGVSAIAFASGLVVITLHRMQAVSHPWLPRMRDHHSVSR